MRQVFEFIVCVNESGHFAYYCVEQMIFIICWYVWLRDFDYLIASFLGFCAINLVFIIGEDIELSNVIFLGFLCDPLTLYIDIGNPRKYELTYDFCMLIL